MKVQSDHKRLEIIVRKSLQTTPRRLQRILLWLQRYDLKVVYKKGKGMVLADTLSRAYLTTESRSSAVENGLEILNTQSTLEKKLEKIAAVDCYFITTSKLQKIKRETAVDDTLQALQNNIHNGWTEDKKSLKPGVYSYFSFRDELVVEDGVVYRRNRCIIPHSLRRFTLGQIRQAHIGIGEF